jgi:hypothetical protein
MLRPRPVLLAAALSALAAALPTAASAAERTVAGWPDAPGPSRFDRLPVTVTGPASARTALVLVPGTAGGRGDFALLARDLVRRVPGLQVWAVDRRSEALEDTTVFADVLAGRRTLDDAVAYYLSGALARTPGAMDPVDDADAPFVREWGLEVQLQDLRRVVRAAGRGGRRVILGGHSLGASVAAAYAAWDFGGRPGHRDIDGLVLIDGGALGRFPTPTANEVRRRLAELRAGSPFLDLLGLGIPWASGVFAELGAIAARTDPTGRSTLADLPFLPPAFRPPVPVTNRGLLGYAFDATTSPQALRLIQVRAGKLAASGEPRDWADGEVTPIARLAQTFGREPGNAVEWYFPRRLSLDLDATRALRRDAASKVVGGRAWHRAGIDVPLYALQTSLTAGRVLRGARELQRRSAIPRATLVDASARQSHLDPLTAAPQRNDLVRTLVPWLARVR